MLLIILAREAVEFRARPWLGLFGRVTVVAAAASAPHVVLTGDSCHQQDQDVAGPGGVLGVKPAGEQNS
jgi:hypothetical protein